MSDTDSANNTDADDESVTGAAEPETGAEAQVVAEPDANVEAAHVVAHHALETPWGVRHYTFTGSAVGLIFIWFSMTPSLLPRGPLFQALVGGFSGAIGYGLGVFSVWLVRYMREKESSPPPPSWAWKVL